MLGAGCIALLLLSSCADAPALPIEERARAILASPEPLQRGADFATLLTEAEPADLPALRSALSDSTIYSGDPEIALLALWWARFDPKAAREWTLTDWRASYGSVISAVYRSWAHVDPETAFAEVKRLGAPVQRELAVDAVTLGWDESGHPGLLEYVRALEAGVERQRPAEVIARRRVATLGAEGAIAWLDSLPDDGFTFILRNRVASAAAETDPAAAAAWAEPRIAAAERPTGLPRRIGTRWVRSDGRAAMKWLASLPAGKDRNDGVAESFRDWMKIDPEDARAWAAERIAEEPLEAWSEPALSVHSRLISRAEPEAALALVARFSDEELRNMTTTVVARGWLERDPAPADEWLQQADIPYDVRRRAYMINSKVRKRYRDEGRPLRLPDPALPREQSARAGASKQPANQGDATP
jgi:hypothetical protein